MGASCKNMPDEEKEPRKQIPRVEENLDLTGEVCPYTFVKSKLALEELSPGDVLRVIVDYKPAVTSVPRSMRNDGQEVLAVRPTSDGKWEIVVRKS